MYYLPPIYPPLVKCLFSHLSPFPSRKWAFEEVLLCAMTVLPYGTFTRGCTNKLNFFPSIVNAGHAVMGHKAALKKNPACHFLLMHLFWFHSPCLYAWNVSLVFHQGQENLINSER